MARSSRCLPSRRNGIAAWSEGAGVQRDTETRQPEYASAGVCQVFYRDHTSACLAQPYVDGSVPAQGQARTKVGLSAHLIVTALLIAARFDHRHEVERYISQFHLLSDSLLVDAA